MRRGPQKYPGASTAHFHGTGQYSGSNMEVNVGVLHTTETTTLPGYNNGATAPTITALPDIKAKKLRWHQHYDIDESARALMNKGGGVETNTANAVQVELVGTCDPKHKASWGKLKAGVDYIYWPDAPDWALAELAKFVRWMHDEHGVKLQSTVRWTAYPKSYGTAGGQRLTGAQWNAYYGWCGHQHVPENDHGDPGDLDFAKVLEHAKSSSSGSTPGSITPKSRESKATVTKQATRALKDWPFIPDVEKKHGLPANLLLAVGSRETNLVNKTGDHGHGHGVWQQDDRWWTSMPADFDTDVRKQAEKAAKLLADNHKALGDWAHAIAAYNKGVTGVREALAAGKSADSITPGGDYAADVLGRLQHLEAATPPADNSSSSSSTYTVKKGDTLTSIAKAHNTTAAALTKLNKLTNPDDLNVGQKLKLKATTAKPAYEPFPGAGFFHGGRHSPIVTALGRRLVALGHGKYYRSGPGPDWTNADKNAVAAFQRSVPELAGDPDGIPGPKTWALLKVPKV